MPSINDNTDSTLLWQPSQQEIEASTLFSFMHFLREHYQFSGNHYIQLHQWSIQNKALFWKAVWLFFDVQGNPGNTVIENSNAMPGAKWFPDAQLNFAQNLLRHTGNKAAIIERGEDGRRNNLSYDELTEKVTIFANHLKQLGVKKGDCVAGFLPNSHYAVVSMLATASLGAIWTSCSPDFGFNGVLDRFAQIKPKVLIATDGYYYAGKCIHSLDRVQKISLALESLDSIIIVPYLNPQDSTLSQSISTDNTTHWDTLFQAKNTDLSPLKFETMAFDDPLYVLYSSGTTGKPKCIVHSVGGTLLQHLKELSLHSNVNASSNLFYYTTCGWMMWNWLASGLALGASLVLFDGSPFHPQKSILFDIADEEEIDVFGASAKYYSACEKFELNPISTHTLTKLKTILSTGSPLSHESFDYLYQHVKPSVCVSSISGGTDIISCFALGCPILPVYRGELQCLGLGMDVAFYSESGELLNQKNPQGSSPGTSLGSSPDSFPEKNEHKKGELVCRQPFPSMPTGFWNDADGKKYYSAYFNRFPNIWAHGDYGEITQHGGVIIHGRSDAVLNPGGVRIGTAEIYRQVEKVESVFESIAIGQQWKDDVRIILFVRLKEGFQLDDSLQALIKTTIKINTTPRHVPSKIIQVKDIPRTLSGKIVELAVRNVIHGKDVLNKEALANPDALDLYKNLAQLKCD
jgi:acetoacetyl-CoA synthetase